MTAEPHNDSSVRVLFFAHAAKAASLRETRIELDGPCPLSELKATILARHPGLAPLAGSLLWSVDEVVVDPDFELRPGQTVGVLPPFSGG